MVVLQVPGGHEYVAHTTHPEVAGVEPLDAADLAEGAEADDGATWRPSPGLDPLWVSQHADAFDVLHLHFGFEGRTPQQLRELVGALRRAGRPLVLTVHDLENPHLPPGAGQASYLALLDVLVPAADALLTLTPGAAAAVAQRWGRRGEVVPHPHVAPLSEIGLPRSRAAHGRGAHSAGDRSAGGRGRVVGVHLKGLRGNQLGLPALRALSQAVAALPDTRLRVHLHDEVLDPGFPRYDAALVGWLQAAADGAHGVDPIDLRVHGRLDDAALRESLRALDVCVLTYGHGTHSGWLELCHDLGTPVLAGRVGFLAEQQALVQVDLLDPSAVLHGLQRALAGYPGSAATFRERLDQRLAVAVAHRDVYRRVLADAAAGPGGQADTQAVPA